MKGGGDKSKVVTSRTKSTRVSSKKQKKPTPKKTKQPPPPNPTTKPPQHKKKKKKPQNQKPHTKTPKKKKKPKQTQKNKKQTKKKRNHPQPTKTKKPKKQPKKPKTHHHPKKKKQTGTEVAFTHGAGRHQLLPEWENRRRAGRESASRRPHYDPQLGTRDTTVGIGGQITLRHQHTRLKKLQKRRRNWGGIKAMARGLFARDLRKRRIC